MSPGHADPLPPDDDLPDGHPRARSAPPGATAATVTVLAVAALLVTAGVAALSGRDLLAALALAAGSSLALSATAAAVLGLRLAGLAHRARGERRHRTSAAVTPVSQARSDAEAACAHAEAALDAAVASADTSDRGVLALAEQYYAAQLALARVLLAEEGTLPPELRDRLVLLARSTGRLRGRSRSRR